MTTPVLPNDVLTLTPDEQLEWLKGPEAKRQFTNAQRRRFRRMIKGEKKQATAKYISLYPYVCSDPWAQEIATVLPANGHGCGNAPGMMKAAWRHGVYPPFVERDGCGMLYCCECGIATPRNNTSDPDGLGPICDDCGSGRSDYSAMRQGSVLDQKAENRRLG